MTPFYQYRWSIVRRRIEATTWLARVPLIRAWLEKERGKG